MFCTVHKGIKRETLVYRQLNKALRRHPNNNPIC